MAGAVVIQEPSPFNAAESAVEGYTQQRNTNRDKALALALERQKMENDERYRQRSLDLQQSQIESQNHARDVQTKIAEADAEYQAKVRPILYQLSQQQLQGAMSDNALKAAQVKVAQIDADTEQKLANLGLPVATAQAHLKQLQQAITTSVAQQHAAEAQTNRTNALLPGEVAQQGALTKLYGAEATRDLREPAGGFSAQKFKEEQEASYEVGKSTVDDLLASGKPPAEVKALIRSSKMDNITKLRLLRYIDARPAPPPQPQQPNIFQRIGGALSGVPPYAGPTP